MRAQCQTAEAHLRDLPPHRWQKRRVAPQKMIATSLSPSLRANPSPARPRPRPQWQQPRRRFLLLSPLTDPVSLCAPSRYTCHSNININSNGNSLSHSNTSSNNNIRPRLLLHNNRTRCSPSLPRCRQSSTIPRSTRPPQTSYHEGLGASTSPAQPRAYTIPSSPSSPLQIPRLPSVGGL